MERTDRIAYAGHGGDEIEALLVRPAGAPRSGVLLIHEVFGLDAHMESVAGRLAASGFAVLAPDLYSREAPAERPASGATLTPEEIRARVAGLPDRRVLADLERGLERLDAEVSEGDGGDEHLACMGFCMGGTFALLLACTSRRLGAAVDFYGRVVYPELSAHKPSQPLELALNLSCPLLAFFGGRDESIPPADVDALRQTLDQFAKDARIEVFPDARHGFFNDSRGAFDAAAADQAWQISVDFLHNALQTQRA